jgi:hypothetical protein
MHQAAVEDAEGRAFEGASKFVSSFAASVAGGPVGSVAFGAAEVAIASSEAGVHLAGLLSGASSEEQAREAVIERAATCIGATVGVLAGAGAEHIVPHGWVGRVLGAVMELGAAGKAAEGTRVILRP